MILSIEDLNKFHCDKCNNFITESKPTSAGMYAACIFNMIVSDYEKCPYFESKEG